MGEGEGKSGKRHPREPQIRLEVVGRQVVGSLANLWCSLELPPIHYIHERAGQRPRTCFSDSTLDTLMCSEFTQILAILVHINRLIKRLSSMFKSFQVIFIISKGVPLFS